ncbi:MAG: tetratricopeptide repeat protein [Ferruginibacter sp.]
MIKLFVVTTLFSALSLSSFAQTNKTAAKKTSPSKTNTHLAVFNQSINSGDAATAISALNYYIAETGNSTAYADTLAMLYTQQGAYAQSYYWAQKRLEVNPEDDNLLEIKGVSLDKLQQPKEAIEVFEKLFKKTKSPYHGYKLMELQYSIKRLSECLATADATERLTFKPEYLMTYNFGQQVGRTYLQAGVFNIHALALYDVDKKAEARTYFEKALALDSTFALAKQNLEAMNSLANQRPTGQVQQPIAPNQAALPANKQN